MAFKYQLMARFMKFMSKPFTDPKKEVKAILKSSVPDPTTVQVKTRHGVIPVYVYQPKNGGKKGVYFNMHGGGFVMKNARQDDAICKYLAEKLDVTVVSPEYNTAPKYKFPVPHDQCFDVYKWMLTDGKNRGMNTSKIAMGGQSAGAAMGISNCTRAHEEGLPVPQKLIPIFTPGDSSIDPTTRTSTIKKPMISQDFVHMVDDVFLTKEADKKHPMVSPLQHPNLGILPETILIAAEHDTLFTEEKALAEKIKKDGAAVKFVKMEGVDHYFTHTGPAAKAKECLDLMVRELQTVYN